MDAVVDFLAGAGAAPSCFFGLMRAGKTLLALRVDMLREVIACPEVLDPLPSGAAGLCGAVRLRGSIIPVVDLQAMLGEPSARLPGGSASVIVVMRCDGRLLGLRVDGVQGMAEVAVDKLQAFSCVRSLSSEVVSHTFVVEEGIALVLDAHLIAATPGLPMVTEPRGAPRSDGLDEREPMLLFSCGKLPLGIAASCVEATVPRSKLRDSSLVNYICRGVVDHHGHEVPVIDTLRLLGLGEAADDAESALVVVRYEKGLLAFTLDEVRDIIAVRGSDILPLASVGLKTPHFFRGMLGPAPEGAVRESHLLLDHEALRREDALATLAGLSRPKAQPVDAGATQGARAVVGADRAYLTYLVEVETASPLIQITEILDFPQSGVVRLAEQRDATLGIFSHRGIAVPLVCLGTLLGRRVKLDVKTAQVLIVECDRRRMGFVVQALCSIETASWESPVAAQQGSNGRTQGLQPLVEFGHGNPRRTLTRLDLLQMARGLTCAAPAAPAALPASASAQGTAKGSTQPEVVLL